MRRGLRLAFALTAVLAGAGEARAQFGLGYYPGGYANYGWGGWGGGGGGAVVGGGAATVEGNMARGLGYYTAAAGEYNEETAEANSINTNSVMRWNQFTFQSQQEANRRARARMDQRMRRDAALGGAAAKQRRDEPTGDDVASGNMLNTALDQISDPRVHGSSMRMATAKIPGKLVRGIPFVNASEAIAISLDQLTAEGGWPTALRGENFAEERKAYSAAVKKVLEEDENGDITPKTLDESRAVLGRLKAKLEANRPTDRAQFGEAEGYLKTLYGMNRMLDRPDVAKVVAELDTIKETTLGSLLGFMHTFNLRFGRATTPDQRAAYTQLYPLMAAHRDQVVKEMKDEKKDDKKDEKSATAKNADAAPDRPTDFFRGLHMDRLEGKRKG